MELFSTLDASSILALLFIAAIVITLAVKRLRSGGADAHTHTEPPAAAPSAPAGLSADIVAAITAAVNQYRKNENH